MRDHNWLKYYAASSNRTPRPTLITAMETWKSEPGLAIDLGCGAGRDTIALLAKGWSVCALDSQQMAIEALRQYVPIGCESRLQTVCMEMESFHFPNCQLINASFSLPFCSPLYFDGLWQSIEEAVCINGLFSGQLLGLEDDWSGDGVSVFRYDDVVKMFLNWKIVSIDEIKQQGFTATGRPKFWHYFNVVAQKKV